MFFSQFLQSEILSAIRKFIEKISLGNKFSAHFILKYWKSAALIYLLTSQYSQSQFKNDNLSTLQR